MDSEKSDDTCDGDEKIKIHILYDTALVWRAQEWKLLRQKHRIVGGLSGSLPRLPQQNNLKGLPIQLLKEEATLLVENGFAEFEQCIVQDPTQEQVKCYKTERSRNVNQQAMIMYHDRKRIRNSYRLLNKLPSEENDGSSSEEEYVIMDFTYHSFYVMDDVKQVKRLKFSAIIHIPTAVTRQHLIPITHESCIWQYPATAAEKQRYAVFHSLWRKGFYITPGGKFGGDYLVYSGDPSSFHSTYIVKIVLPGEERSIRELIAFGRLCTNVKKTGIYCIVAEDKIKYLSVKWTGMA